MSTGEYLSQLAEAGIRIVWEGQDLVLEGNCSDEKANEIRKHKPKIMSWLAGERPLTDAEKADIARVFEEFRDAHGRELHAKGWNRDLVFGGLDPLAAVIMDDVPGIIAILRSGGVIEAILPNRILLRDGQNQRLAWVRTGWFAGGKCLQQLEDKERENA